MYAHFVASVVDVVFVVVVVAVVVVVVVVVVLVILVVMVEVVVFVEVVQLGSSRTPQPQTPGSVLAESCGHLSKQSGTPSVSLSKSIASLQLSLATGCDEVTPPPQEQHAVAAVYPPDAYVSNVPQLEFHPDP
jgi:hypothetical protein